CRAYVLAVAAQGGFIWSKPDQDYGIDLSLRSVSIQKNRRRDGGATIDLQLKSTTRAIVTDNEVVYDLEVDAYNDLRNIARPCPLILVLLVMPVDETHWLAQTSEQLTLRHCAYWVSLKGYPPTKATRTIRIAIPLANIVSVEALTRLL